MTISSSRTIAFAALIAFGTLMSGASHAAILRSTNGNPVLTKDGNCVITGWEGSEDCEAAKAGMGDAMGAHEYDKSRAVYFGFNSSALTPHAKKHLDHLAEHIIKMGKHVGHTITIVGFADRIGNASYNHKLAMRRAEAVRAYLVAKGVKAKKIEVRSLGKSEPRAECSADLPRAKLIECLHEDRRVEIEFGAH